MSRRTHTSTEVKDRYNRKAYDSLILRTRKGGRMIVQAYATAKGYSVNGYIQHLIIADMRADGIQNAEELIGGKGSGADFVAELMKNVLDGIEP